MTALCLSAILNTQVRCPGEHLRSSGSESLRLRREAAILVLYQHFLYENEKCFSLFPTSPHFDPDLSNPFPNNLHFYYLFAFYTSMEIPQ
jgi:hypothetical protein